MSFPLPFFSALGQRAQRSWRRFWGPSDAQLGLPERDRGPGSPEAYEAARAFWVWIRAQPPFSFTTMANPGAGFLEVTRMPGWREARVWCIRGAIQEMSRSQQGLPLKQPSASFIFLPSSFHCRRAGEIHSFDGAPGIQALREWTDVSGENCVNAFNSYLPEISKGSLPLLEALLDTKGFSFARMRPETYWLFFNNLEISLRAFSFCARNTIIWRDHEKVSPSDANRFRAFFEKLARHPFPMDEAVSQSTWKAFGLIPKLEEK